MPWSPPRLGLAVFVALACACVLPLSATAASKSDHLSHAVPGKDRVVKDYDGDGFAEVTFNAELSHTHYFNPHNSSDMGRIVEYRWTEDRLGTVISDKVKFTHQFPIGKTLVTLFVRDNSGDNSTATVSVTVEPSGSQGAYFYYYDMQGETPSVEVLDRITNKSGNYKPKFGTAVKTVNFVKSWQWPNFPDGLMSGPFAIDVTSDFLALRSGDYSFYALLSPGYASISVAGQKLIAGSNDGTSNKVLKTNSVYLEKGKHPLQLRFFSEDPRNPVIVLGVKQNGPVTVIPEDLHSYSVQDVVPTIHEASPLSSTLGGGGVMRIKGEGFYGDMKVRIGDYEGENVRTRNSAEITLRIPSVLEAEDLLLSVSNARGTSNELPFSYNKAAPMPIKFKQDKVRFENGTVYPSQQFTSVALGPDLRYYFGSLDSHVHVVTIKHQSMTVLETCKSVGMGMGRSVTAVAFNPADREILVYISTNMFYWRNYYSVPDVDGWHNGKVQMLKPGKGDKGECLVHEKDVLTGLPVSNHDHGVNTILFDNDGNLYVQVGGSTNAGVSHPDDLVGGVKESVLSSATVIAHLRAPNFDGHVKYDQYEDPGTAKKLTSDEFVSAFAFGFRNSFGAVYHTSGNIFATDNGPNEGYGPSSTTCDTEGPDPWFPDSLVLVQNGSYFGYPNRARGRNGDERQCKYYAADETARNGFTPGLATFDASTNGVLEYTANCFEGQLKGDLLISKYAVQGSGKLYRAQLDATKKALKKPVEDFQDYSGLSIAMNPYGTVVMPRVQQPSIALLVPDEEKVEGTNPWVTAVTPHRGPASGGNIVFVSGNQLGKSPTILFDGRSCKLRRMGADETWALCEAPPGKGSVHISVKTEGGEYKSLSPDYHYMSY